VSVVRFRPGPPYLHRSRKSAVFSFVLVQTFALCVRKNKLRALTAHYTSNPNIFYLRDGEVVLYRCSASPLYQCRFELADRSWYGVSTRKASVESAISVACEMYDEIRFRLRLGLERNADATLDELRKELDLGRGKSVNHCYITCIEKYFLPYFADK
jgi:integrase